MQKNFKYDVIIIGSGLSGVSCAFELVQNDKKILILEARDVLGGRTSSWNENGMDIESGLHKFLGFYTHLPRLIKRAGLKLHDVVKWENELEIRMPESLKAEFGTSLIGKPFKTVSSFLGNTDFFPWKDKVNFVKFVLWGLYDYYFHPIYLDTFTVAEYAKKHKVTKTVYDRFLIPFTEGIFFLSIEKYSAFALFSTLGPYLPSIYKMRLGAFKGGMSDVLIKPIIKSIKRKSGEVKLSAPVSRLLIKENKVCGVFVNEEIFEADTIVIATALSSAKEIIKNSMSQLLDTNEVIKKLYTLSTMPAVTVHIELTEPSLEVDRATFAPYTTMISFAEQSRTTFKQSKGRLSIDMGQPDYFIDKSDEIIIKSVKEDAKKIGIDLSYMLSYRVVRLPADFYALIPGSEKLRPIQRTGIAGLVFCGDYTKQKYLCTMEGAVYSGKLAAKIICTNNQ